MNALFDIKIIFESYDIKITYTHRIAHKVLKTYFQWDPVKDKEQEQDFDKLGRDQSITTLMNHRHFGLAYTHQIMHIKQTEQNSVHSQRDYIIHSEFSFLV